MVERSHQSGFFGTQQAVPENVPRHIANANSSKLVLRRVNTQFAEVTLNRNPGAPSGNGHFLVVVAIAAARGKCVAHPEVVFRSKTISDIRKCGCTFVGCNNQIVIV